VTEETFAGELRDARSRAERWRRRAGLDEEDGSALLGALGELDSVLEELRVAEEEIRSQREELALVEGSIAAERERYRELFQLAPAAYLVTDAHGLVLDANWPSAMLLGVPAEALLGKPLAVYVADEDRQRFRHRLLHANGMDLREWELRLRTRRGRTLRVAATVGTAREVGGRAGGLRWLLRELPSGMAIGHNGTRAELALQRSLLPRRLPAVAGVELAAHYLPSHAELTIGGDFYDVIGLRDGRVGLVIGDVAGHGVQAAAVVGQLRAGLRAYVLEGHGPAAVIGRLGRLLEELEPELIATCCYLVVDPASGEVGWSSAGHLPAFALSPDGLVRRLEAGQGVPLGVPGGGPVEQAAAALEPGSLLLLYTDGLVERRGEPLDQGLDRLERALRRQRGRLADCCDLLLAELVADQPVDDDIALLALRLAGRPQAAEFSSPTA
jgi:PAS domain S-box-containing protein